MMNSGSWPLLIASKATGATVEVNFAQIEPEVVSLVVPEGTLTASGTFEVGATAGTSLLGLAKQLVLSGIVTDQCVESAIRDACDLGYLVTQVTDACLTYTQERHDNSLRAIKGYCRQKTTDQVIAELA